MTVKEFQTRFAKIKSEGYVPSLRRGPTGIGYTFEQLLGITENNIALPDLGTVELKTHREGANAMITLFTFNRDAWHLPPLQAIQKFGTLDANGRRGLYFTMSKTPNSSGLFIHLDDETVAVRHISGEVIALWKIEDLTKRFIEKIPAMILVSAFIEERGDREWFHFYRAQLLTETSQEIIHDQLQAGNILIDLRLHEQGTKARNHGTGFRVYQANLPRLFREVKDL